MTRPRRHDISPVTGLAYARDRRIVRHHPRPETTWDPCPDCEARLDGYAPPDCEVPYLHKHRPKGE